MVPHDPSGARAQMAHNKLNTAFRAQTGTQPETMKATAPPVNEQPEHREQSTASRCVEKSASARKTKVQDHRG
eukprot:15438471-Alexandrium_andersonii.AAC.2